MDSDRPLNNTHTQTQPLNGISKITHTHTHFFIILLFSMNVEYFFSSIVNQLLEKYRIRCIILHFNFLVTFQNVKNSWCFDYIGDTLSKRDLPFFLSFYHVFSNQINFINAIYLYTYIALT